MKTSTKVRSVVVAGAVAASAAIAAAPAPASGVMPTLEAVEIVGGPAHAELYAWGVAARPDGSVLVGDYWNQKVQHYGADGTFLSDIINNPGFQPERHQSPYGLASDPVDGSIYMADTDRRSVIKFSATGEFIYRIGPTNQSGTGPNKFKYPSRVAVAPNQNVYVSDAWDNVISVHDPVTGAELYEFGSRGPGDGQFKQPRAMDFDAAGNLFVVDSGNRRIQVLDQAGNYLYDFGEAGWAPGFLGGDLRGLAIDKANGWVYVVEGAANRVSRWSTAGAYIDRFGVKGEAPGQFIDGGREIAVDGEGKVWVGDWPDWRVQAFIPDPALAGNWTVAFVRPDPAAPPAPGGFNGPRGVAVGPDGQISVTDTYNQRIETFDGSGSFLTDWGRRGRGEYGFNYPRMIAADPSTGNLVVADTDNHSLRMYTPQGAHVWSVGSVGAGQQTFRNPHGVDISATGEIAVADTQNGRIVILSVADGSYIREFGTKGGAVGQFKYVRGVAWDPNDGTLWTMDSNRDVLGHYTADGTLLGEYGSRGTGDAQFAGGFDVEVGADHVYVADAQQHRISVWSRDGVWLGHYGVRGKQLGKFIKPQGLDLYTDPSGDQYLFVAEQLTDRITKLKITLPTS